MRGAAAGIPDASVEDACLFAWLQLLRAQPDRGQVRAWLFTVARHEARRLRRQAERVGSLDAEAQGGSAVTGSRLAGPLVETIAGKDTIEASHTAREALRALASLPENQRRYLALKVAGHSYREICVLTGASYTNVNKHLTRARARVREQRAA